MPYEALISALLDNEQNADWEASQPPEYCPHDGTVLEEREDGVRHCPMGNYRWVP